MYKLNVEGILFMAVCLIGVESAVLSDACADSGDCSVTNARCSSNVCVCENNYVVSSEGLSCEMVTGLDGTCTVNASCSTTIHAVCSYSNQSGSCVCGSGYVKAGSICKSELGNRCLQKPDCHDKNAVCTNNTCVCKSNNFDSDDQGNIGGTCILKKKLDESCPSGVLASEPCADLNARCVSGTCQCLSTHYDSNGVGAGNLGGICKPKVMKNRICPQPSIFVPDTATCIDTNTRCVWTGYNYYCKCLDSHFEHSNGVCTPKEELGRNCPHTVRSTTCSDANARCSSGVCVCPSSFYDSNGIGTVGGTCLPKVNLNGDCPTNLPNTEPCSDSNARCTAKGTCECISTHYDNNRNDTPGGTCRAKVRLSNSCPIADACVTTNAVCQEKRCVCDDSFFDDNGSNYGGSCKIKFSLSQTCPSYYHNIIKCIDVNAECRYNSKCVCTTGYSESEGKCIPNQAIGGECRTTAGECSDGNADCINNKCVCNTLSYDDNGLSDSGNCRPMTRLKVSGVVTSDPQTTGFTVKWTAPIKREHVSGYTVQWCQKNSSLGGDSVDVGNETSYVVGSGVIAGKDYIVKVISRNEITQVNFTRTVDSEAVEQTAKPGTVEQLFCDPTIVDASYGRINLNWTLSTGVASKYIVKLLDGNRELASSTSLSPQGYIYYENMLDGHSYTISVTALSENTRLYSEASINGIKTVVKEPGPPTNVECVAEFEDTIRLTWFKPRSPKGTIEQYHVTVKNRDSSIYSSHRTGSSITTFDIGGLKPGTYYRFEVITENESYNSSTNESTDCTTEAKTSDAPTELTITVVTTRSVSFEWNTPTNTYSEEILGYVIQVIDESDNCAVEKIYGCYGCFKTFQVGDLQNLCNYQASPSRRSKSSLIGKQVYTATGLMPNTPYTVSVSAINLAGRGQDATEIQKTKAEEPGPTTSVKCVQELEDTIRLTWLQPVLINGHIKQYHIIVKQRDSSTYSRHRAGSSTTMMDIGGLQPGSYYRFEVITENESFNSSRTGSTAGFCTTKARTSDAPSDFKITDVTSTSITLKWNYPADMYSEEMLGYIVQVKDEQDKCALEIIYKCSDCFKTFPVSDLQSLCNYQVLTVGRTKAQLSVKQVYTATGLIPNTPYTVSVSVINLAGRGQDATEIQKTKAEEPGPPTSVKCVQEFEDTIRLTWLQPVLINGHIKQYHIIVKQRDSSTYSRHRAGSSTTMMDIGGLQPGSYYRFEVITENESFNSSRTGSTAGFCTTKARTSDAPSDFKITNVTSTSITLKWNYPANIYSEEMLGYIVQVKDEQDDCVKEIIYKCSDCFKTLQVRYLQSLCDYQASPSLRSKPSFIGKQVYTATGLIPNTPYTVSVSAINLAGRGQDATEIQKTKAEEAHAGELGEKGTATIVVGVVLGVLLIAVVVFLIAVVVFILVRYVLPERAGTLRRMPVEEVALSEMPKSHPSKEPTTTSVSARAVTETSDRYNPTNVKSKRANHPYENVTAPTYKDYSDPTY